MGFISKGDVLNITFKIVKVILATSLLNALFLSYSWLYVVKSSNIVIIYFTILILILETLKYGQVTYYKIILIISKNKPKRKLHEALILRLKSQVLGS